MGSKWLAGLYGLVSTSFDVVAARLRRISGDVSPFSFHFYLESRTVYANLSRFRSKWGLSPARCGEVRRLPCSKDSKCHPIIVWKLEEQRKQCSVFAASN